ncbi:PepSY domain-containing protein [Rhodoferax sp.]|uniref:PepSY domain-containing protein n=1 Tax=Rhodoferax sp. TaxID=50421 RepID=UPI0026250E5C|nr:PepSY domain-containing protein [Rhodoferax sp.]MDD2924524.1 PepSY domain-containing protein [Rhodoferax sp.]
MKAPIVLISALLLALATPVWAEVSRDDAAAAAQKSSGGRVLAVEKTQHNGQAVWRVKVLTPQGEIRIVLVDAANGRTF